MDPYFSSKQIHSVDAKGRIVVPVKFREKLGDKFVVAWLGEYLTLYPIDEWNKLLEKLEREIPATESDLIDILSYNSETLEMDKQGRVILPQDIRDVAGIVKDVVTVGVIGKVHLYAKEAWDAKYGNVSMKDAVARAARYNISL